MMSPLKKRSGGECGSRWRYGVRGGGCCGWLKARGNENSPRPMRPAIPTANSDVRLFVLF